MLRSLTPTKSVYSRFGHCGETAEDKKSNGLVVQDLCPYYAVFRQEINRYTCFTVIALPSTASRVFNTCGCSHCCWNTKIWVNAILRRAIKGYSRYKVIHVDFQLVYCGEWPTYSSCWSIYYCEFGASLRPKSTEMYTFGNRKSVAWKAYTNREL